MATTTTGVSIPLTSSKDVYPSPSSPGKSVFALPGERGFALPGERGFTTPSSPGKEVYPSPASPSKSGFALPSSPSKSGFPLPSSPSKIQTPLTSPTLSSTDPSPSKHKFDRPNPHPYAIKTTSTALLARSNSSSGNVSAQRHAYVPVPVSPGHSRGGDNSSGGGGHRYTRSLSGVGDIPVLPPGTLGARPLPAPPELRRATLPVDVPSTPMDELPENPKLWTPAQLSAYLAGALRVRGEGTRLPERVVSDVASFVRQARIGGRAFLRLNEADLEG
ncbi:hypothetical protein NEOLEDRAFT_1176611 [Neolentinus lepideus HHB14362 ss-1]|uniref:Uncharacterized protein n=1 Tax=Neolentinus lepideus HHB14362 ss-1 TaxID=1314782 RepID=A0A165U3T4_9AGAM|nr:hypothetical protein NEOLEDRAFT_1176611 [Neolentinus lepideus HHB14362 ss-1]